MAAASIGDADIEQTLRSEEHQATGAPPELASCWPRPQARQGSCSGSNAGEDTSSMPSRSVATVRRRVLGRHGWRWWEATCPSRSARPIELFTAKTD
uniref:Uncharacterized protein n=1 Tax=Oryza punctata TaxID=4537 RepID=A0A0E0JYX6_ORYPU